MKLFISQPMRGRTDAEILAERNAAIEAVKKKLGDDVEPIDSFFETAPHEAKPLWFLSKSIELLAEADAAYFCDGWESARGCRIEHMCAVAYGLNIFKTIPQGGIIMNTNVKKYRKKPVVIEAYQTDKEVIIHTLEGDMTASIGDYIITGVNGEKYPCKPDIFEKTYEPVEE